MKQFIRNIAKTLSNYKLLAKIMLGLSAFVAVVVLVAFVAFQLSKGTDEYGQSIVAFGVIGLVDKTTKQPIPDAHHQMMGMFCFLLFFATLVLAIVVIAKSFKFAFPKEKMTPSKTLPVLCLVNAGLCVVDAVFCVIAVVYDHSIIPVFWYVVMALYIVAALVNACMAVPVFRSHYYMPELAQKK